MIMPEDNLPAPTIERPTGFINLQVAPEASALEVPTKIPVILVRTGREPKKYQVAPGTTVEQLFQFAEADPTNQDLSAGSRKIELGYQITKPEIIFAVSKPKNA
jgi:hypothetical protein